MIPTGYLKNTKKPFSKFQHLLQLNEKLRTTAAK